VSVVKYFLRLDRWTAICSVTDGFCYIQLFCWATFTVIIYMQLILRTVMGSNSCKSNPPPKKKMEWRWPPATRCVTNMDLIEIITLDRRCFKICSRKYSGDLKFVFKKTDVWNTWFVSLETLVVYKRVFCCGLKVCKCILIPVSRVVIPRVVCTCYTETVVLL